MPIVKHTDRILFRRRDRSQRKLRTNKQFVKSMTIGDNEGYAAEVADAHFAPNPTLIASVSGYSWFDPDEDWPWEPVYARQTRKVKHSALVVPSVITWIESQAAKHPVSHVMYNAGRPSHVLAEQVIRRMLGIKWTASVQDKWARYRRWRADQDRVYQGILHRAGVLDMDEYVARLTGQ